MDDLIEIVFALVAISIGFVFGKRAERKHYENIRAREQQLLHIPLRSEKEIPAEYNEVQLVMGNVVIATDRFKAVVGSLQGFFGGNVRSLDSFMDRGRREAILRLKEQAQTWGAKEIIHVRVDSCMLDNNGVEVFASGTAVR